MAAIINDEVSRVEGAVVSAVRWRTVFDASAMLRSLMHARRNVGGGKRGKARAGRIIKFSFKMYKKVAKERFLSQNSSFG